MKTPTSLVLAVVIPTLLIFPLPLLAAPTPIPAGQINTVPIMKQLLQKGQYEQVKKIALVDVWEDIWKPEPLQCLVMALEKLNDKDQAGVFTHILLKALEEIKATSQPQGSTLKKWAESQLVTLDVDFKKAQQKYQASAAGKKFPSPDQVDDQWMTQVQSDLHPLHGLCAWTLVGGRKDYKPDWIHNLQGVMHRSGMKYMNDVDGRKGVLYAVPMRAQPGPNGDKLFQAYLDRIGHPTQITTCNFGKCKFLRLGVKGYNFPFLLKMYVGGKEIFSQEIGAQNWSDVKIDLADAAGKDDPVIELVVPEGQRWSEGVWIDYLDFFED